MVNGDTITLPADTVVASSIGAASLDENGFPNPNTFERTLGIRDCPCRVIAMKIGIDWLVVCRMNRSTNDKVFSF